MKEKRSEKARSGKHERERLPATLFVDIPSRLLSVRAREGMRVHEKGDNMSRGRAAFVVGQRESVEVSQPSPCTVRSSREARERETGRRDERRGAEEGRTQTPPASTLPRLGDHSSPLVRLVSQWPTTLRSNHALLRRRRGGWQLTRASFWRNRARDGGGKAVRRYVPFLMPSRFNGDNRRCCRGVSWWEKSEVWWRRTPSFSSRRALPILPHSLSQSTSPSVDAR